MFGRKSSRSQPHATFLLPSFPGLFWNKKSSLVETITAASPPVSTPVPESDLSQSVPFDTYYQRLNVTSANSTASTSLSSSVTTPVPSLSTSLSTSPSSVLSTTPQSVASAVVQTSFLTLDSISSDSEPSEPQILAASPDIIDDAHFDDSCTPILKNSQTRPSVCTRKHTVGSQQPPRRVQRVLPTTLRCRRCSADLAFASQIVSKGFTGRHGRAYLVSAPATHAGHLFAPEPKYDDDTTPWDNEEEDAIWEDAGVFESEAVEGEQAIDDTASDGPLARGLVRAGGIHDLPNIRIGRAGYRRLVTGMHVVADISCAVCRSKVGWKYIDASAPAQRYKVGKFVLELALLSTFHSWEDVDVDEDALENMEALANNLGAARSLNTRYLWDRLHNGDELCNRENKCYEPGHTEFDSEDDDECEEIFNGTWDAKVVARRRALKLANELRQSS
ncbi:hypothetical protein SEPCBS119000_003167 [Sporothrix epigloea]|uniref:Yippee domain-containing protein n=1 Tax=Sporothrix epigloea TaxID=1892477 RepID=A0ABP0DM44_9PEZI